MFFQAIPRSMRWGAVRMLASLGTLSAGTPSPTPAQVAQSPSYEVVFENDAFIALFPGPRYSDREYTNGIWLATERNDAPVWHRLAPGFPECSTAPAAEGGCLQTRFEFGQKIFTPNINLDEPPPTERPYAGWLFASATARRAAEHAMRSLRLEVGVTGPPSGAEASQKVIHVITGYPDPKGWDYQLAFEPGVLVQLEELRTRELRAGDGRRLIDGILTGGLLAGNVRTGARGAAALRAGHRLPHPWLRADTSGAFAVYAFAEYQRQWTAYDLFLDGNTYRDGPSVERIPFTGAYELGTAAQYRGVRLRFSFVWQDRLYETQPRAHRYSALTLTYRP